MVTIIRIIAGEKGTGKTKRILDLANETSLSAKGSVLFIDDNQQYMFELKRSIRFIDASEYHIDGPKMFFGFLSGLAAQDFDLEYIFIDGFAKIVHHELNTLEALFNSLEEFAASRNINLIFSINYGEEGLPEFIKKYAE
ncbi:MAG: twitching motility protein PilT [Clostridia bacterium]|nr:twitching motility protein PilT [Clostridia bacterium]